MPQAGGGSPCRTKSGDCISHTMRALAFALDFQPVLKEAAHHIPEQAREQAQGSFSVPSAPQTLHSLLSQGSL